MQDAIESLKADFSKQRMLHQAFTDKCKGLIETLLKDNSIEYFSIESRTKTQESFEGKIQRDDKSGKYAQIGDVTDISGVRIIAYLQEDCIRIISTIRSAFSIDEKNSDDKSVSIDPDKFGYLSSHLIASFTADRIILPEFKRFDGLKVEFQVRTLLQHTWAAIDWKLRYKSQNEAPKELRRRLYRISALLEAADDDFSFVSSRIQILRQEYEKKIKAGDLQITINSDSLSTFIDTSKEVEKIMEQVLAMKGNVFEKPGNNLNPLRGVMKFLSIDDIESLNNYITAHMKLILERWRIFMDIFAKKNATVTINRVSALRISLIFTLNAKDRSAILQKYPVDKLGVDAIMSMKD